MSDSVSRTAQVVVYLSVSQNEWPQYLLVSHYINIPKDPWTLQWRGWNLYSRGPGSQNRHF